MEDMQFNTPQDKLLVMLIERISALEDRQNKLLQAVEQSNKNLEYLWVKNASCYYSFCVFPKLITTLEDGVERVREVGNYIDFIRNLETVKNIIKDQFPQCKLYIDRRNDNSATIYMLFNDRVSEDNLIAKLELSILQHLRVNNWNKLTEQNMKNAMNNSYSVPF